MLARAGETGPAGVCHRGAECAARRPSVIWVYAAVIRQDFRIYMSTTKRFDAKRKVRGEGGRPRLQPTLSRERDAPRRAGPRLPLAAGPAALAALWRGSVACTAPSSAPRPHGDGHGAGRGVGGTRRARHGVGIAVRASRDARPRMRGEIRPTVRRAEMVAPHTQTTHTRQTHTRALDTHDTEWSGQT